MSTKAYHKLVRDRIPEIIEADGKTCVCETLSDEDYLYLLDQKLNEELAEYQESKSGGHTGCRESPWMGIGRTGAGTGSQSGQAGRI